MRKPIAALSSSLSPHWSSLLTFSSPAPNSAAAAKKKRSSHTEGAVWHPATTEFFEKRWDPRRTCRGCCCCCCNPWVLLLCSWRDALDPSSPERGEFGWDGDQTQYSFGGQNPNNTWDSVSKLLKQTQTRKKHTHLQTHPPWKLLMPNPNLSAPKIHDSLTPNLVKSSKSLLSLPRKPPPPTHPPLPTLY